MDMGIGFSEILLILVLILVFFGSKELPKFIREAARLVAKVRKYGDKVKQELNEITSTLDVPAVPHDTVIARQKKELRKKFLTVRKNMPPQERDEKSRVICSRLMDSDHFKKAGAVMMYVNRGAEVQTRSAIEEILRMGKRVMLPYCQRELRTLGIGEITDLEKDLIEADNKIPEPRKELRDHFFRSDLQLIVCPGVGFDIYGGRLGRGAAYYDNFLREIKNRIPIFALAFDCQIQNENLPFSYSDVPMDQIITESGFRLPYGQPAESIPIEAPPQPSAGLAG